MSTRIAAALCGGMFAFAVSLLDAHVAGQQSDLILEGGQWTIRTKLEFPGRPPQERTHTTCISSEKLRDPVLYFTTNLDGDAAGCTRGEPWKVGKEINWLYKCTGSVSEMSAKVTIESAQHYTLAMTMRGPSLVSLVADARRAGPCA